MNNLLTLALGRGFANQCPGRYMKGTGSALNEIQCRILRTSFIVIDSLWGNVKELGELLLCEACFMAGLGEPLAKYGLGLFCGSCSHLTWRIQKSGF